MSPNNTESLKIKAEKHIGLQKKADVAVLTNGSLRQNASLYSIMKGIILQENMQTLSLYASIWFPIWKAKV